MSRTTSLPEVNVNLVMGHGGLSPKELRASDRVRHTWEFFIPSVRKANAEYYDNLLEFSREHAGEYIAHLHYGLRNKIFAPNKSNVKLHLPGMGLSENSKGFAFSDITAYTTLIESEVSREHEHRQWGLFVVNAYNRTRNLFYLETSVKEGIGSIDAVETVDPETGTSYTPLDFNMEGQAQLYQTADRIIDRLSFAVNHDTSSLEIS